jgi:hypothetical protein
MARTLSNSIITALSRTTYITEDLLEIYTGSGTNYFYTTGQSNITIITPTQAYPGANFTTSNGLTTIDNLVESYTPVQNDYGIQLETFDNTVIANIETNFQKCRLVVYKMFRDSATNAADVNNLITVFDGTASSFDLQGGEGVQTLQIKFKNIFSNLGIIKGRTNSQLEPTTGIKMMWGTIVWQ